MSPVVIFTTAILACIVVSNAMAAEHTVAWEYTPTIEPAVVGYRLWRGADPYELVAEFPGWARGGKWTQETPIASGEAFTLTAEFGDGTESPRSAAYVYPMGDGTTGIRHSRLKALAGTVAAPLTKPAGARLR